MNELRSSTGAKITVELIGPETAADLLENHNPKNRTIAPKTVEKYDLNAFFNGLITGAGLEDGNPILTVRESISRAKRDAYLPRSTELYYLVRAWNAWRADATLSKIQLPKGGDLTMRNMIMK